MQLIEWNKNIKNKGNTKFYEVCIKYSMISIFYTLLK